jgi:uncharacterized protein (DUF2249 family)
MNATIDLCAVGLAERNTLVARRFEALAPGATLEIITDTPPWVLYHQLRTDWIGEFDWKVVESGRERYVVHLTRTAPAAGA